MRLNGLLEWQNLEWNEVLHKYYRTLDGKSTLEFLDH